VIWLSALRTGYLYPPGNIPGTHFCWRLRQPQGHSAAGRIMSMKTSNDTIGNRTRDLQPCIHTQIFLLLTWEIIALLRTDADSPPHHLLRILILQ